MTAYYNENDKFAADWLENLIAEGLIAPGDVDRRSIVDVEPSDLGGYTQAHFFAGIGGWSYALRLAGWPDDKPVWTGSCPCQPFSQAGKRDGTDDARHLWPQWYRLIQKCAPSICFGEQVASADGRAWLSTVRTDLEAMGYAVGAADLCAAGVGAPHIRQRLYFGGVGDTEGDGREGRALRPGPGLPSQRTEEGRGDRPNFWVGNTEGRGDGEKEEPRGDTQGAREGRERGAGGSGAERNFWTPCDWIPCREPVRVADADADGIGEHAGELRCDESQHEVGLTDGDHASQHRGADSIAYRTIYRPTQPGLFPLASRLSGRVGVLRGAGNSIVPQAAAEFILALAGAAPPSTNPQPTGES